MKALLQRWLSRLEIWDLLRLLAGHFSHYRHLGLIDLVAKHTLAPRRFSKCITWVVNSSNRVRGWVRRHAYMRWRYCYSRLRWRLRREKKGGPRMPSTMTFSLLCPSRGRVSQAEALIHSVCLTAAQPDRVELLFYVDSNDPCLCAYRYLFATTAKRFGKLRRCVLVVGEPMTIGRAWNVLARTAEGDVLMMANDDQLYVDYGWDDRAAEAFEQYPDSMVCTFFDQNLGGGRADFPMVPRRWFEVLGYFTPELFAFWWHDQWIIDVATRAGRMHAIKGVCVDHVHFTGYLAAFDETYQRHCLAPGMWEADQALFAQTAEQRARDALRVREAIAAETM